MRTTILFLLAAAGCAIDEDFETNVVESEENVEQWDYIEAMPGHGSIYQVGLASFGGRLHMISRDTNTALINPWLEWASYNGHTWSAPERLDHLRADYGPALTVFENELVTIYNSYSENRLLMSTSRGQEWSSPVTAGTSLYTAKVNYAPSAVDYRGRLYLAYCKDVGPNDQVQIDRYNGSTWTAVASIDIPSYLICKSVALASLPGPKLHLVWNVEQVGTTLWYLYEAYSNAPQQSTMTPRFIDGMRSKKPSSLIHCNGLTHFVHGGFADPEEVWWSFREDGAWTTNVRIPGHQSVGGAQLACFNGTRPMMVHNGEDTAQLYHYEYLD
jgi:hypothetical protein